jgi:hypothetical protein
VSWGSIPNNNIDFKRETVNKNVIPIFANRLSCPECYLYSGDSLTIDDVPIDGKKIKPSQYPEWKCIIE